MFPDCCAHPNVHSGHVGCVMLRLIHRHRTGCTGGEPASLLRASLGKHTQSACAVPGYCSSFETTATYGKRRERLSSKMYLVKKILKNSYQKTNRLYQTPVGFLLSAPLLTSENIAPLLLLMAVVTLCRGGSEILSTYDMIIQIGKPSGAQCRDVADCYF